MEPNIRALFLSAGPLSLAFICPISRESALFVDSQGYWRLCPVQFTTAFFLGCCRSSRFVRDVLVSFIMITVSSVVCVIAIIVTVCGCSMQQHQQRLFHSINMITQLIYVPFCLSFHYIGVPLI